MTTTTCKRDGGRCIELFVPFEWQGSTVRRIDIGPCRLDHLLRWREGEFATAISLLAEMVGTSEKFIRQICYPDADRVIAAFIEMLPPPIQADIGEGLVPALAPAPPLPVTPYEVEPELGPLPEADEEVAVSPAKPEPGWPYQGQPPEPEPETENIDLIGDAA